jgi:hypothetical protein
MLKKLNWQGYANGNRNLIIDKVKTVINKREAYIINFNTYSDLAISLSLEVEEKSIRPLYDSMTEILTLSDQNLDKLDRNSDKEWLVLMNISFGSGKGNMKSAIPNVPG